MVNNYPKQEDLSSLSANIPSCSKLYLSFENSTWWKLHFMLGRYGWQVYVSGYLRLTLYYWASQVFPVVYFENLRLNTILELFQWQKDSVAEW